MVKKILFWISGGASLLFVLLMELIHIFLLVQSTKNIRKCRRCLKETKVSEKDRLILNADIADNKDDIRICIAIISDGLAAFAVGFLIGYLT